MDICSQPCIQQIQSKLDGLAASDDRLSGLLDSVLDALSGLFQPPPICEEPCIQEILDLLHELLDRSAGGTPDEFDLIFLPYGTCGNESGQVVQQQLEVRAGSVGAGIVQNFQDSAQLAIQACESNLLRRIYEILGGDKWDDFQIDPEKQLREVADRFYENNSSGFATTQKKVTDLTELQLALQSVNHIRSGHWRYPTQVDNSIVKSGDDKFDDLFKGTRTLNDAQDYRQWFLEQFDATMGKWHQVIEIEDTDLEQEGNQTEKMVLTSVAESMSELLGQLVVTNVSLKALLNMGTRTLIESCATKKESICNQKMLDAIIDYLGFNTEEMLVDIPILATLMNPKPNSNDQNQQPTQEEQNAANEQQVSELDDLHKFLEASTKKAVVPVYRGETNYQHQLTILSNAAAIIRAVFTRVLPQDENQAKKRLIEQVKEAAATGQITEDFDTYLERVERGFIDQPGISDAQNPFGRPLEQRPRIRDLSGTEDDDRQAQAGSEDNNATA